MIEFPEAATISRQMGEQLAGKQIAHCLVGTSAHKFAFYSYSPEKYAKIMTGAVLGQTQVDGSHVMVQIGAEHTLVLGGGGEKILLHNPEEAIPPKHQLLLKFKDGRFLTVSVQGWGAVLLFNPDELAAHPYIAKRRVPPLDEAFTLEYFQDLFKTFGPEDKRAVKYFVISDPQIHGVGNGYLQDILYGAKIHPRRRAVEITPDEKIQLYESIRITLSKAVGLCGRDTECDLYGNSGGYTALMDRRTNGTPCNHCGTTIEKASFLGGSVYFCPGCQKY